MANYTTKNIEEIQKGDRVISYNIMTQEFYESEVRNLIINHNTTDLAIILFDDNSTLEMNAYHPLLTQDGFHSLTCYNNYKLLTESDSVKTLDGYKKIIKIQRLTCNSPMITYNLNIQDLNEIIDDDSNDTFIANNCVVHNAPCPT